jgi:mRNA-degrading endonuclease YafQ of YafQ-DinJ toxin-antitoxin module
VRVALTERFQRDVRALSSDQRGAVFEVMLSLPGVLGNPHRHAGAGIRKLHRSGIWEARVGLGLRLVYALEPGTLTLARVGTHDEIRRYLKDL